MNTKFTASSEMAADIKVAKYCSSPEGNPNNDERELNIAAYHTQQAIEKGLKFFLRDVYGEDETKRRFWTHDIAVLIERLSGHGFEVPEELASKADIITDWESDSRYSHSLVTERNEIENALDMAERLLSVVKNKESEINTAIEKLEDHNGPDPHYECEEEKE